MTNSVSLQSAIKKSGLKYKFIAGQIGLTPYGLKRKIDGKSEFKGMEIQQVSDLLNLTPSQRDRIFFAQNVDE